MLVQDAPPPIVVPLPGSCEMLMADGWFDCRSVVYYAHEGRVVFIASTADGTVGFSGGRDERRSARDYRLILDQIHVEAGADILTHPTTGECVAWHAADRSSIRTLRCTAETQIGRIEMQFTGDVE